MTETSIELDCPACGARLRIPAGIAPPHLRCPACGQTFRGVASPENEAGRAGGGIQQKSPPAESRWQLRTPEGLAFGPVSRDTLERWVHEGRVTADCQLRRETDAEWSLAEASFAALRSPLPPVAPSSPPPSSPTAAPSVRPPSAPLSAQLLPHRGPLILTLALVGLLVQCPIFSIMAWVMGSGDLDEMARGRMDPSGASITRAGRTLGLILSLFWIIMAVILVAGLIFVVAIQAAPR